MKNLQPLKGSRDWNVLLKQQWQSEDLDQYKLKPIQYRPAEQTLCIREKNAPSHAKPSRLVDLQSWRYFDYDHGHDAQRTKASWQWNQTSNPCNLEVKAAVTNLVICLGSQWVYRISGGYHLHSFSHASHRNRCHLHYLSRPGEINLTFFICSLLTSKVFQQPPTWTLFLFVCDHLLVLCHFKEEIPKDLYHNDNETSCFTGEISGSIFVVFWPSNNLIFYPPGRQIFVS